MDFKDHVIYVFPLTIHYWNLIHKIRFYDLIWISCETREEENTFREQD